MKKFVAVIMSAVLLLSVSLPVFAISGEDLLKGALITVVNEAVKQDQNKNKNSKSETQPKTQNETPQPTVTKSEPQTLSQKQDEIIFQIGGEIEETLGELGDSILAYNKPALEVKLSKQERTVPEEYYDDGSDPNTKMIVSPIMYSRVCVKGKTIVLGSAEKNKKFKTDLIVTGEPDFPPKGKNTNGIYVGANINVIEKRVGISAQNITRIQQGTPGTIYFSESFVPEYLAYNGDKITELYFSNGYSLNSEKALNFVYKKAKELGLQFPTRYE